MCFSPFRVILDTFWGVKIEGYPNTLPFLAILAMILWNSLIFLNIWPIQVGDEKKGGGGGVGQKTSLTQSEDLLVSLIVWVKITPAMTWPGTVLATTGWPC